MSAQYWGTLRLGTPAPADGRFPGLLWLPNFADHEFGWLQALGFRMEQMPACRCLGACPLVSAAMRMLKRNPMVPYGTGLERDGEVLLKPFCPPYYSSMAEAVRAVADLKFGVRGVFRGHQAGGSWSDVSAITAQVPPVSEAALAAVTAYCEYLWKRNGRFPVYLTPYRTVNGFQACHLDCEFYDRFYQPSVLGLRQRADFQSHSKPRERIH